MPRKPLSSPDNQQDDINETVLQTEPEDEEQDQKTPSLQENIYEELPDTQTEADEPEGLDIGPQEDSDNIESLQTEHGQGDMITGFMLQHDSIPFHQTEFISGENILGSADRPMLQCDILPDSQTEPELTDDGPNINDPVAPLQGVTPILQTESGSDDSTAENNQPVDLNTQDSLDYLTEPEQASHEDSPHGDEKPKARRRASKSQSDETSNAAPQTDPEQAPATAPARRQRARTMPVLSIDEQPTVETSEDKMRNDLLDLIESQKSRKILTGTIQGVERSAGNQNISFAVIYHGSFKVIIPSEETVQPPDDYRERSPADVMHYLVTKRLGAEIDYIVKGVDVQTGIAAASRLEAMAAKRRQYYFGTDRDGNNIIYEDLSAEARVVSVIRAGIFIDLFGLESYIPLRELSYQRLIDATAHFQPGQRVLVNLLKLDRSDRENIRVSASVKQAGENPYEQALKRYIPGSRYVGTVAMVDTNGVFVSLAGGIDCLYPYPKRGRPPRGSRVTVRIIGVNHDNNRIWGAITHMTTAR